MKKSEFSTLWKQYEPLIQALAELFHPFVEAAVHDLEQGKLVALYHNLSERQVGDPSPLKELKIPTEKFPNYFPPYYKQNWDGRPLKCTSVTLRNKKGKPIGLICINIDVSHFQEGYRLIEAFLKTKEQAAHPIDLFGNHCENQAETLLQEYLDQSQLSPRRLTRDQKKELVRYLYKRGVFNFKNAVPFIAKKLSTSRTSIYNYLKN